MPILYDTPCKIVGNKIYVPYNNIKEDLYDNSRKIFKKIRPFYEQDLIKVIIGIRRCGESILLLQIMDELKQEGIIHKNIIDWLLEE